MQIMCINALILSFLINYSYSATNG